MHASEVLDHKADLIDRLGDPVNKRAWRNQIALDMAHTTPFKPHNDQEAKSTSAAIIENCRSSLPQAACYQVTEELSELVQAAAAGLEETDRIDASIVPTRAGLVRFDKPLPVHDIRDKTLLVSWLAWFPVMMLQSRHDQGEPTAALSYLMWNDRRTDPDDVERQIRMELAGELSPTMPADYDPKTRLWGPTAGWTPEKQIEGLRIALEHTGRWALLGTEVLWDGMKLGPKTMVVDPELRAKLFEEGVDANVGDVSFTPTHRYVHALWLLLGQTVVTQAQAEIPRMVRRRAERRKIPARVTVVQLRRLEYRGQEHPEGSLVQWSHRWLVRGFWRWQVCGPNHPLAQEIEPGKWRARMWIAPHVKGPAGKPLVVSEKVYKLSR